MNIPRKVAVPLAVLGLALAVMAGAALMTSGPDAAGPQVTTIGVAQAKTDLSRNTTFFLDVREPYEFRAGHIPGAVNVALGTVEAQVARHIPDKGTPIDVYCRSGRRSAVAARTLVWMGYRNVRDVAGGMNAWQAAGYPVE